MSGMNQKRYRQIRIVIIFFMAMILSIAIGIDSYLLAMISIITGIMFSVIVKSRAKIRVDEREMAIREKAANLTYAIFAPTIGLGAALLILIPDTKDSFYLEALGTVLAYLSLFLIALYAISYSFLNKKYGGSNSDEK
ncbi:MAG: hypothetical protein UT13_C0001G0334 [Candidatus Pacebacteria bacterium GW2011_GWF2_38_9]|nr:MAG: hypothetical protein US01_C0001G0342 [candidate division TM6 bacterium GW2011_GWF2_28_16]KKQ10323.1 MAG: hypothetical protein US20_C0001G0037 [Candidatus Pacebacteria bacterium GW2011_GWF1_36_5]KKQ88687.1 MAG: hypothetical protein UT13_C0001G0334 [Candidatus Pacebacteria bacterium GW2011_GWF2_38_9]HAZ73668.1 hypothetical protein [Candidatus Paceibacterota bacterium]